MYVKRLNVRETLWAHFRYGITFDMFLLLLRGPYQILMQSIMVRVRHGLKQDSTIVASIIRTPYPYPFLRWRSCTKGPFPCATACAWTHPMRLLGGGRQSPQFWRKIIFWLFLSTVRARVGSPQSAEHYCPPSGADFWMNYFCFL